MVAKEGAQLRYARPEFCTDNGAMIAYAGAQRMKAGQQDGERIVAVARWPMSTLPPISEPRSAGLID